MEQELSDAEIALAALGDAGSRSPARKAEDMTPRDIAAIDPEMRTMVRELTALEYEATIRRRDFGPGHPRMREAQTALDLKRKMVEDYAAGWKHNATESNTVDTTFAQRRTLEAKQKRYAQMAANTRKESLLIGADMLAIEKLKREEEPLLVELKEVNERIAQLGMESKNTDRVEVPDYVDAPLMVRDGRAPLSVAAGVGGVLLALLIVLARGALDSRLRSPEDAFTGERRLTLLGVLPNLPEDLANPDQAAVAAHCVHRIRTLLQITCPVAEHAVFAITSPAAATGKTSLCLSLGVSFAASNARTLMIDCDLVGGGLTARVDAIVRRKIGQIFQREGLINAQQLDTALKLSRNSQRKIGQVLVELGYLTEADVQHALTLQDQKPMGLMDALAGEKLADCVAETGIAGLSILPVGAGEAADASRLSPTVIRSLLQRAREHYDTILVDTGPVPGSLEASAVSAAADGVVLVVSRGNHRPQTEKSIQHLRDIGARLAGMVFNRAQASNLDLDRAPLNVSSVRPSRPPRADAPAFGPVALAVASRNAPRNNQQP